MKNRVSSRYRSLLARGGAVCAISILLLCATGCHSSKDTDKSKIKQPTTTEVSTSCTTSTTTSTTTSSTTSSTTTSVTTTVAMMTTAEPMTQKIVSESTAQIEPEPTTSWVEPEPVWNNAPISDYERILLNNVVAREYGSDWVSVYDKACVVATVMNRVNSSQFPNTIEGVLTQPNQFSGYYACNYEWNNVTDSVRESVDYYFNHQDEFGNYLYFYGDGTRNYFY